jgi:hypothetical protein
VLLSDVLGKNSKDSNHLTVFHQVVDTDEFGPEELAIISITSKC